MKGTTLQHIHALFYRKGQVVSQHAAAQGCASRVFLGCLRHLNTVTNTYKTSQTIQPTNLKQYI